MNPRGAIVGLGIVGLAAAPAMAQDLPIFDEGLGFDVRGTVDDGLIVSNGGHVFYCEVEDTPGDKYFVLDGCAPIIGPRAAMSASRATLSGARGERAFRQALEAMQPADFAPAVAQTFERFGCVINFDSGEDAFLAALAHNVAKGAGYDGRMTDDLMDTIRDLTDDTGNMMVDAGEIILERGGGTARLVDCP